MNQPNSELKVLRRSKLSPAIALGLGVALIAACASVAQKSPQLVRLESELSRLQATPAVAANAREELASAEQAVHLLANDGRRMRPDVYDHNVYIADRLLQIAEAEGRGTAANRQMESLATERERLVADARRMETDRARLAAAQAEREASAARADAMSEHIEAEFARQDASQARSELSEMRDMMIDLQARQTERGLVVTLGDVLFETDRSELKPGAQRNLDQLVAALSEHPDTSVAIEGHTDSVGDSVYNAELSRQRAMSVQNYLGARGVDRSRLSARGLGEDFPVASKAAAAGRQQNRRVEIIIADQAPRSARLD